MWCQCAVCGAGIEHDPMRIGATLPHGWRSGTLQWRRVLLCANCEGRGAKPDEGTCNFGEALCQSVEDGGCR